MVIDPEESHEIPNSKNATATFLVKFPGDKQPSSLRVLTEEEIKAEKKLKVVVRPQTADDNEKVPFIVFECRGLEPLRWHPTGDYCAEAEESGTLYENINFADGDDWCEYDEKSGNSISVGAKIDYEIRRL